MKRLVPLILVLALVACAQKPRRPTGPSASSTTIIVKGAKLRGQTTASSIRMDDGVITEVGDLPIPDGAKVIDAHGGMVVPGFHDAHIHLLGGGLSLSRVQLEGAKTLDETLARVKAWADAHPDAPWVLGRGWSYDMLGKDAPKGAMPTKEMLDKILPDRPVLLRAYDGHTAWANSKAIELAKITKKSKVPAGGSMTKDKAGNPAGAFLEDAEGMFEGAVPEPTRAEKKEGLLAGIRAVSAQGVTAIDAIEADEEEWALLLELEKEGQLPMRVNFILPIEGDFDHYLELKKQSTSRVRFVGVKGFVDGVVESKTAYMLMPYEGGKKERGKPIIPQDKLFELVDQAHARGLQVSLHCIGDAAVRLALDAYKNAAEKHPEIKLRHRIEHIEVLDLADAPRFAAQNVVASMQPYHAVPSAEPDTGAWSENLGEERRRRSFAWRALLDAKAPVTFGSDWPVFTANPLLGLLVATTRQNEEGVPPGGWNAHQKVTVDEAIHAYAVERGEATAPSTTIGELRRGQLADLVVLPNTIDADKPLSYVGAVPVAVIVAGQVVAGSAAP